MFQTTNRAAGACLLIFLGFFCTITETAAQDYIYVDEDPALKREAREKQEYFEKLRKDAEANRASCIKACNIPIGHAHDPNDADGPCKPAPLQACQCHCSCTQSYDNALVRIKQQEDSWRREYGTRVDKWKAAQAKKAGAGTSVSNAPSNQQYYTQLDKKSSSQQNKIDKFTESVNSVIEDIWRRKMAKDYIDNINTLREVAARGLRADLKNGGKLVDCTECDGSGLIECDCGGNDRACKECVGVGYDACDECFGVGLLYEADEKTAGGGSTTSQSEEPVNTPISRPPPADVSGYVAFDANVVKVTPRPPTTREQRAQKLITQLNALLATGAERYFYTDHYKAFVRVGEELRRFKLVKADGRVYLVTSCIVYEKRRRPDENREALTYQTESRDSVDISEIDEINCTRYSAGSDDIFKEYYLARVKLDDGGKVYEYVDTRIDTDTPGNVGCNGYILADRNQFVIRIQDPQTVKKFETLLVELAGLYKK